MSAKLSPNFTAAELCCPHCKRCEIKAGALLKLEALRALVKAPLKILSGYRCPEHNKEIGGEQGSKHCDGIAFDVAVPTGISLKKLVALAEQAGFAAVGAYPAGRGQNSNFIHVDDRAAKARWARIDGKYVGIAEAFA